MPAKTKNTRTNNRTSRGLNLKAKPVFNKKILLALVIIIAAFGAWRIFFAAAAPNNCQQDSGINVCDIDQTAGGADTILSVGTEALTLGNNGWGTYYGPPFRAPTGALKGAVPVYRIYNEKYTWHDWVTDAQKKEKESKYDGTKKNEGVVFYAWTTQVTGTVPVYRLTRGGGGSQSIFNTDKAWIDKMLAADANNPDGWKSGTVLPAIAFYAYPPNYKVADQVNPYDCSIQANFLSDRCTMQRENLTKPPQTSTPPRPTTTPTTSQTPAPRPAGGTATAPTVSKPLTPPPAPPQPPAAKYDDCPTAPSMDAGLAAYIDGVNNKKRNYGPDCHTWYLTHGKNKSDRDIAAFAVGIINACKEKGGQWVNNECNYDLRNYLNYAKWRSDACTATNQAYDAPNDRCTALPQNVQYSYTCTVVGKERIIVPKRGEVWLDRTFRFPVYAVSGGDALRLCAEWRSGLNRQDKYKEFYIPVPGGLVKN